MKNYTINKMMMEFTNRVPNEIAFSFPEENIKYTYKEFDDEVNKVAKGLISLNIKKNDKVALWMPNIKEWFVSFFAIQKLGAIAIPVNTSFKVEEIKYIIDKFDINCLIMNNGYKNDYEDIINEVSKEIKIPKIVSIGFKNDLTMSYNELIENGINISTSAINKMDDFINYNDPCIILPTSGTTGFPKGAVLKHGAIIKNGYDIGERLKLNNKDKMLIQVPMFHCFGITLSMFSSLTHLTPITVISHFNAEESINIIEKEKITCINGVPTMFEYIMNNPKFSKDKVSSIKKGIMAGSNCLPDFIETTNKTMDMDIVSVYGLTEASPGCTMSSIDDDSYTKKYTVGKCLPNVECKIINPKTGLECENNDIGEVIVKGYNIMEEYYNMKDETNNVIDKNGWLHTGDLAYKDNENRFVITGRIKDIIIRGGENISPKEIETILNKCPGISSSTVFGVSDPTYGQKVMACVTVNDKEIKEDNIKSFMKGKCASYKIPEVINIVKKFPTNAAGKVLVYKLREIYSN